MSLKEDDKYNIWTLEFTIIPYSIVLKVAIESLYRFNTEQTCLNDK